MPRYRRLFVLVALAAAAAAACGGSSGGDAPVKVLYAGSLTDVMEHRLGPAFEHAQGATFQGYAAGSTELAQQIKGKVRQGDVFISASPDADAAAGSAVRWYATFARSPVVIGYNPKSAFAKDFKSKPWYDVVTEHGIRVGRTDPKLDPKGKKTAAAVGEAASKLRRPSLGRALDSFPVYPEETLVGRLQAGQLDAGFFYTSEAQAAHIPTVTIAPASQQATYTVTVLDGARNVRGAREFVRYLLSASGKAALERAGFEVMATPKVSGDAARVPASVKPLVAAG